MSAIRGLSDTARREVEGFCNFVDASPSPFHAVREAADRLEADGFRRLSERDVWDSLEKGGKYYVTRNQTALVAFTIGERYEPGNGFTVMAAHTDSPCLKIKPRAGAMKSELLTLGTEFYGGGIWHTWFDRDLSIAGRVLVSEPSADGGPAKITSRLVKVDRPLLRIPSLAIHLDRTVNDKFAVNKEEHLWAMFASEARAVLETPEGAAAAGTDDGHSASRRQPPLLLSVLCEAMEDGTRPEQIHDFELFLFDTQRASLSGAREEFVASARLDNLLMSYLSLEALRRSASGSGLAEEPNARVLALFDNEEVGSDSVPGAGSTFLEDVLQRINGEAHRAVWPVSMRRSVLISADMAHGCHPNYSSMHDRNHRPAFNKGIVIKTNANQRYSTTAVTASIVRRVAERLELPVQDFVIRQDLGCGSTIGPILSTRLGMRTVDVGVAQFAMHSIREVCGSEDIASTVKLLEGIYHDFPALEDATEGTD